MKSEKSNKLLVIALGGLLHDDGLSAALVLLSHEHLKEILLAKSYELDGWKRPLDFYPILLAGGQQLRHILH